MRKNYTFLTKNSAENSCKSVIVKFFSKLSFLVYATAHTMKCGNENIEISPAISLFLLHFNIRWICSFHNKLLNCWFSVSNNPKFRKSLPLGRTRRLGLGDTAEYKIKIYRSRWTAAIPRRHTLFINKSGNWFFLSAVFMNTFHPVEGGQWRGSNFRRMPASWSRGRIEINCRKNPSCGDNGRINPGCDRGEEVFKKSRREKKGVVDFMIYGHSVELSLKMCR